MKLYVDVYEAATQIIFIKQADGKEFGITYGRSDFTGLENGKLHDISTIVNKLAETRK